MIMNRIKKTKGSKRALTLVELILAMALTSVFAAACIMLIAPVSQIYTHMKDQSRAQLVADTVVDALRTECARTYIHSSDDVWISSQPNIAFSLPSVPLDSPSGSVLIMRRNYNYCETISTEYNLVDIEAYDLVMAAEEAALGEDGEPQTGTTLDNPQVSRAIYRMFIDSGSESGLTYLREHDAAAGIVHFGYFEMDPNATGKVLATKYYDFTNPLPFSAYGKNGDYTVGLNFHDLTLTAEGDYPAYVLCDVSIFYRNAANPIYTRSNVVLCFASPVL